MSILVGFDPFNKPLDEITANDLTLLCDIAEGWYVEYKTTSDVKKIAKSISSFANHYGGWIFYGVDESRDGQNTAGSFPGLSVSESERIIDLLTKATANHINPTPFFEYHKIDGPCISIQLPQDHSIIIVRVPSGSNPPYIHSSGRIYRRIADSSEPKEETNRFVLDDLWRKSQATQSNLDVFLLRTLEISEGESGSSFLRLFMMPDPLNAARLGSKLKFTSFKDTMQQDVEGGIQLVVDNFYMMSGGFVARMTKSNNPYNIVMTWEHLFNGASVVTFPLSSMGIDILTHGRSEFLDGYQYASSFLSMLTQFGIHSGVVLDLNDLIFALVWAIEKQHQLMHSGEIRIDTLYAKTSLKNVWRRTPFLDTQAFLDHLSSNGIPIIQNENCMCPPGTSFENLVTIQTKDRAWIYEAVVLLMPILHAFGIPGSSLITGDESIAPLWEAAIRSGSVRGNQLNRLDTN